MIRLLPFLSLFLLIGCSSHTRWVEQRVHSDYPQFNSQQLTFKAQNTFNGIEVQFLRGHFGTIGFLNIFCQEFQSDELIVEINKTVYRYQGLLMEGNQRLQLPPEATLLLISTLLNGESAALTIDSYYTYIVPGNFSQKFL